MNSQEFRINLDNTYISIIKFGNGPKNFIILPGLSLTKFEGMGPAIANAYKLFGNDYTCYLIAPKNLLPQKYSLQEVTEDTYRAMKELGINKADYFGASMGGMLCMQMAISHPEIVNKISLGSTTPLLDEKSSKVFDCWLSLAKEENIAKLFNIFCEKVYSEEYNRKYADAIAYIATTVTHENVVHFITLANAIVEFNIYDELPKIKCPVQYLGSKADKVFSGEIVEKLLKSKLALDSYLYDGYGHAVYDEAPDFRHRIIEFFNKA